MELQSMTGFARADGENDFFVWSWEIRSVNGKGLDLRFRIPGGFEALEPVARKKIQSFFSRGSLQVSLQTTEKAKQQAVTINEALVEELHSISKRLQEKAGGELPSVAELMAIKGVVELSENQRSPIEEDIATQILDTLQEVLESLAETRSSEGKAIGKVLRDQIENIEIILEKIADDPSRKPESIRENLKLQVEQLIAVNESFDEQRLHQEAALLAAKADIQEELDRLKVHTASAKQLLSEGSPVGRKLDFLAQEFNRECNTICSKSNSSAVTALGLDMKLVIDQFREQLQNME